MKKGLFDSSHPAWRRLNWLDPAKLDEDGELLHICSPMDSDAERISVAGNVFDLRLSRARPGL